MSETDDHLRALLKLVRDDGAPNISALWEVAKDLTAIKLNLKFYGYELARRLEAALPVRDVEGPPPAIKLGSKPSTQADIASDWAAYWCAKLKTPVIFHRKIWEFAYVLQALHAHGVLRPGARGLGFGCGEEPIPSLLASYGIDVTVTDLSPEKSQDLGWKDTAQHTRSLEAAFKPHLASREAFDRHVSLKYVDMNAIPETLRDYDFCWSICAFEHLGSIEKGMAFMENAMNTLRPGGVSVHTTEFNFMNDEETVDNWITVLFQRKHFIELATRLGAAGHAVMPLDFDVGADPMDKFIDMPPFVNELENSSIASWAKGAHHIKLVVDGFPATCFGMVVIKDGLKS